MRVLIVKTSSMGDVLHTLPALTDAQRLIPTIQFDWVVEEGFAQIPDWHSAVNQVIPVALRRWRKSLFTAQTHLERQTFLKTLRTQYYDVIIDAQGLLKSAGLITRHARGSKHGFNWHSAREPLASLFYDVKHAVPVQLHAVERIRQLFALTLNYPIPNYQGDYAIADHFLNTHSVEDQQYVIFLHSTTRDYKHWPEQHWRELIHLLQPTNIKIKLPWGAPHEYERAVRLAEHFDHVEVLPKLSLEQVAQQLAGAKYVISVDTGLSHLAAALDKPNITLYGPTDPGKIGGYGQNQHVMQSPTKRIETITPDKVLAQVNQLFNH